VTCSISQDSGENDGLSVLLSTQRGEAILQKLSPAEHRILKLIAQNKTSKEIALELHISFRTVQNHRAHMCEKLGLEGYNRLFRFALECESALLPLRNVESQPETLLKMRC